MKINAKLYDGVNSKEHSVVIVFLETKQVVIEEFNIDVPLSSLKISSRLGNTPRLIEFPNGYRCKSEQNDSIDAILDKLGTKYSKVHKLESSLKFVLPAFVAMFTAIIFFSTIGLEYTANAVASITPQGTLDYASKNALDTLDKYYLKKSNLTKKKRDRIQKLFDELTAGEKRYKLHFRSAPKLGPNAFALPSGDIVLLDELVMLDKDKELLGVQGVLAHEMGHVVYRHTLKNAIKSSIASAVISYITGDIGFLATTIPTILVTSSYSREFEAQSDDYAIKRMIELNKSTKPLASLFKEMEKYYIKRRKGEKSARSWISSHPSTDDRIKKFNEH